MLTAVIIIGGVVSGIFTATESSAIAVAYAFILTAVVYRELGPRNLRLVLFESLKTIAIVAALITTSSAYGYMTARLDIPQLVTNSLIHLTDNRYFIFILRCSLP
jgi:TRAP-type C4-dicarboxylate transport system permease large subunit